MLRMRRLGLAAIAFGLLARNASAGSLTGLAAARLLSEDVRPITGATPLRDGSHGHVTLADPFLLIVGIPLSMNESAASPIAGKDVRAGLANVAEVYSFFFLTTATEALDALTGRSRPSTTGRGSSNNLSTFMYELSEGRVADENAAARFTESLPVGSFVASYGLLSYGKQTQTVAETDSRYSTSRIRTVWEWVSSFFR